MPIYTYTCYGCGKNFEKFFYIKDYEEKTQCIYCNKKSAERSLVADAATLMSSVKKSDSELKTLGDLANRNRDRMSEDQKTSLQAKHNNYKQEKSDKPLPKGMTRIPKQKKIKWT